MGTTIKLIESLGKLCENPEWRDSLDEIETQTSKDQGDTYDAFFTYFRKQWLPHFENGNLCHYNLEAESRRANSVLEGYNNLFQKDCEKMALSKLPNWDKFVGVLKSQESKYRNLIEHYIHHGTTALSSTQEKRLEAAKIEKDQNKPFASKRKSIEFEPSAIIRSSKKVKTNSKNSRKSLQQDPIYPWMRWKKNSCRIDCLLTIFTLGLHNKYAEVERTSRKTNLAEKLFETVRKLNQHDFGAKMEFWTFLDDYLTSKGENSSLYQFGTMSSTFCVLEHMEGLFGYK